MKNVYGRSRLVPALRELVRLEMARQWMMVNSMDALRRALSEIEVQDPAVAPDVAAPAAPAADPKDAPSALDDAKDQAEERPDVGGAKPPEDGQCRECKRLRRLNRLKLCYPCFVELVIMDEAKKRGHQWKPGDAHPSWCACEGLGEHPDRDNGAWRGN